MPANKRNVQASERLIFAPSVEALLIRGVGEKLTPKLEDELRAVGIDLKRPLRPAYPVELWIQAVDLVAKSLYPGWTMEKAQLELGKSTVTGWEFTLVGKAMFTLAKLYGPKRVLLRYPTMAMSSNNYLGMEAREVSTNQVDIQCQPFTGWPQFFQGNLHAVAVVAGAREPKVEITTFDKEGESLHLAVMWS